MRTETYTVTKEYYTYDELSEAAKEKAREDYYLMNRDPDYYTVSEWMMDIIEDLVVRIKKERFELG